MGKADRADPLGFANGAVPARHQRHVPGVIKGQDAATQGGEAPGAGVDAGAEIVAARPTGRARALALALTIIHAAASDPGAPEIGTPRPTIYADRARDHRYGLLGGVRTPHAAAAARIIRPPRQDHGLDLARLPKDTQNRGRIHRRQHLNRAARYERKSLLQVFERS